MPIDSVYRDCKPSKPIKDMTPEEKQAYQKHRKEMLSRRLAFERAAAQEQSEKRWQAWKTCRENAQKIAERPDESTMIPAALEAMSPDVRRIATLFGACDGTGQCLIDSVRILSGLTPAKMKIMVSALTAVGFLVPDFQYSGHDIDETPLCDDYIESFHYRWMNRTGHHVLSDEETVIEWVEQNWGWRLSFAAEKAITATTATAEIMKGE